MQVGAALGGWCCDEDMEVTRCAGPSTAQALPQQPQQPAPSLGRRRRASNNVVISARAPHFSIQLQSPLSTIPLPVSVNRALGLESQAAPAGALPFGPSAWPPEGASSAPTPKQRILLIV